MRRMHRSKIGFWRVAIVALAVAALARTNAPAATNWKQMIVRCAPEDLDQIRNSVGAAVLDALPGYFLITVPSTVDATTIEAIHGQGQIEASDDSTVAFPRKGATTSSATSSTPTTSLPPLGSLTDWYGTPARQGYTTQAVVSKIKLLDAFQDTTGSGARVALIDTGVDLGHPTLQGVFDGGKSYVGYNSIPSFLNDTALPQLSQSASDFLQQSASDFLQQSASDFLQQSASDFLQQSASDFLQQSASDFLQQSASDFLQASKSGVFVSQGQSNTLAGTTLPAFISHGTMMAGLIHLVAPHARIVPFAAFHADGAADEWNIIRAIYDAISAHVDVINMSFETGTADKLMQDAIQDAISHGIVVSASAGNDGADILTYPGSFPGVVRVAAVRDDNDQKADFSNFGFDIGVSATGTRLISTWPGGHWGLVSGTSPAAAVVSGELALLASQKPGPGMLNRQILENRIDSINWPILYQNKLGKGRIDAGKAVNGPGK